MGVVYDRMHTREIAFYGGLTARMPWFAAIFLMFTMANVGLPGTSGFIGEMLTMVGAYQVSTWAALGAASGVILSAVYALTLYRNVMFGEITNPALKAITDIDRRELLVFVPLIIGTIWLGVYPAVVLDITAGFGQRGDDRLSDRDRRIRRPCSTSISPFTSPLPRPFWPSARWSC